MYDIVTVNAGSGSLKLTLLDSGDQIVDSRDIDAAPDSTEARDALADFLEQARQVSTVTAVAHRFVHSGPHLRGPTLVNESVLRRLDAAADLAPQHVPPALAALELAREHLPDVAHVACFDTTFHASLPIAARTYPVPGEWRERYGLRRYGFHGLSYAWSLRRASELLERPAEELHLVIAHLGSGASVCAVRDGHSVATSMGFTPLEGMTMSRRSGSVDPGMLLWLQTSCGLSASEVWDGLERESGLYGLSGGLSTDTRDLVHAAADGDTAADLAMNVFTHRARQEIAAAATGLARLDALVFTGEIGWDQPEVREDVCTGLAVCGLAGGLSGNRDDDGTVSRPDAAIPVLVVKPQENRQLATETRTALETPATQLSD